jgi:putative alpha-1,2-mannosidase
MFTTVTVTGTSTASDAPVLDKTLVDLYGSKQALLSQLHELLVIPSNFRVGSYNQEIHEMTEMRALAMGQYGHNNQPSHHIPYLFAILGDQETTQRVVRAVMERAYGRDFFAGDEDNGEQVRTV